MCSPSGSILLVTVAVCAAGLHARAPGAARAALLARSRIPRPPVACGTPQQQPQQQLVQQQQLQQQQMCMPSNRRSYMNLPHRQMVMCQAPGGPQQSQMMPPCSADPHQTALHSVHPPDLAQAASMQLVRGHLHMQPVQGQCVASEQLQQQQWPGPVPFIYGQASAADEQGGQPYGEHQLHHGQQQYQRLWQHQQAPSLQQFGRQMQHGEAMEAAVRAASKAASPWVQHSWYPALPGAYQPPLAGPLLHMGSSHIQQPKQQPQLLVSAGSHMQNSMGHPHMQQYSQHQINPADWHACGVQGVASVASEAAHSRSPQLGSAPRTNTSSNPQHHGQQQSIENCLPSINSSPSKQGQQPSGMQGFQNESSAMSSPTKTPKSIIKTYNLNALLS